MDRRSSEDTSKSSASDVVPPVSEARSRNSRKRKHVPDEADIENQLPSKKNGTSSASASTSSINASERRASPLAAQSAPAVPLPNVAAASSTTTTVAGGTTSSCNSNASSTVISGDYVSDTQSSSDCCSTPADFDLFPLASPTSVNSNILSPSCDGSRGSWNTKGDITPHGNRKSGSSRNVAPPPSESSSCCTHPSCTGSDDPRIVPQLTCCVTPSAELRTCPLPALSWADSAELWRLMCRKDEKVSLERDINMFEQHPGLQPRMRAILLDWLMEVCEVYKLHRETYYLAVDYIDRFLTRRKQQKKTLLQLLGITALFVAAKVEEIYPPKIGEFAYVTDGACTEEDILRQELLLLTELDWQINPVTPMGWLGLYLQVHTTSRLPEVTISRLKASGGTPVSKKQQRQQQQQQIRQRAQSNSAEAFVFPQVSGMEFAQTAQLIDLCSLDVAIADYPYSVIAAAAISHTFDRKTATAVSGLDWSAIDACAKWMEPYFLEICDENEVSPLILLEASDQVKPSYGLSHVCPNLVSDSSHIIQTHSTSLDMFDKATLLRERRETVDIIIEQETSPAQQQQVLGPEGLLTPPASSRKPLDVAGVDAICTHVAADCKATLHATKT